jgi:hypothetical protein
MSTKMIVAAALMLVSAVPANAWEYFATKTPTVKALPSRQEDGSTIKGFDVKDGRSRYMIVCRTTVGKPSINLYEPNYYFQEVTGTPDRYLGDDRAANGLQLMWAEVCKNAK